MAENLSSEECDALKNADAATLSSYVNQSTTPLTRDDLKNLRHYDFTGILKAAALYLLLLLTGFVLNALDTWILQKMGQEIIYQMREEVFTHIHSLSLNFSTIRLWENLSPVSPTTPKRSMNFSPPFW